ncbi:hypothetical protein [Nannocystis sp.]|uniref:hypothetical protein n=1 Tax=Nannocystis sp. TaxID=1962667 RepID=UPI0025D282D2|nr:hypothetical protein [Nannocystis sp.]MBK7824344.1 hypothetical protein [Nannocystis sp.]
MNHPVPASRNNFVLAAGCLTLIGLALTACNNRQSVIVPNRVLDRPTDMVLACMRKDPDSDQIRPTSLDLCIQSACEDLRLVGFVANSERDSVAMFSKCANSVLDMDPAAPGAQLIDAGKVPSSMTISTGDITGCFAVSANLGSCDLSLFDVPGLSAYAFDEVPVRDPSELVNAITPTRGDGSPLGARPGQVLATPPVLSNSVLFGDLEDTTGGDAGGTGDTGGAALSTCDPERPGSVYVTFPSCQLIAEVDLRTQRILQSRQFVVDPDTAAITVNDTGVDPKCPIDCPELFADQPDVLKGADPGDVGGVYPSAMAMISPVTEPQDAADLEIVDHALYVGGLGADTLFELRYDGRRWLTDPLQLELQDASGISVIRPTPAMELNLDGAEPYHQFLYIVAGDGSTRVVRRDFDANRTAIGRECDTQVDPTAVLDLVCHPAEFPGENPPDRRPFARGPGIRGPNGSLITDWTFQKVVKSAESSIDAPSSPFGKPGVTGVGATSFGRLVFVTFDQFNTDATGKSTAARVSATIDPLGLLDATIQPHMLWPQIDPRPANVEVEGLPRMDDAEPQRNEPGKSEGADALKVLAPSLRRIDLAYAELGFTCAYKPDDGKDDVDVDDEGCRKDTDNAEAVCVPDNPLAGTSPGPGRCRVPNNPLLSPRILATEGDRLGNPDAGETGSTGLYANEVVRAVVRDYRSWISGSWTLFWEGQIPGTESATGQLVCEHPGWEGGTCLSTDPGDTRIVDSTARFCDAGVLAGDKLQLFGCAQDADCGVGQYCLVDARSTTTSGAPGICVSQAAFANDDYLRQVCADLIYDPCGSPVREYLVTRAFQSELWLQALDRPETAYLMYTGVSDTEPDADKDLADDVVCDGSYLRGLPPESPAPFQTPRECQRPLLCGTEQPETGCETHDDCLQLVKEGAEPADIYPLCIDGLCRRPCGDDEDCILRRLPGPTCVQELARYLVLARHSFVLRGPGAYDFLDQKVRADAMTQECYEDPDVSNLLTSRIRLGSDEADTRNNSVWPIPTCPPGSERPGAGTPNPCFIDTPRPLSLPPDAPGGLFHNFSYGEKPDEGAVPALRFSNPMFSLVLDLTSLKGLIDPVPTTDVAWPGAFAAFKRARIPRNFNESFGTITGYAPYDVGVVTSSIALVGPTRIINAPETGTVFVVDTSGGTGTGGVRGQVVRVTLSGGQVTPDDKFLVH